MSGTAVPPARSYTDLRLELRDLDPDDRYVVSLSGATVGELDDVAVSLRYDEFAEGLQSLEDGGLDDPEDAIPLGRALADRLVPEGAVRAAVTGAIRAAGTDDGVRLRLVIREPRLAALPWEYTYLAALDRGQMSDFLVLDPKVSLVRHEALPLPQRALTPRDPDRLRVVVATANAPGLPTLDLRRELKVVEQALKAVPRDGASVELRSVLRDPTAAELQAALLAGADLFHFAGHGGVDAGGYLALPADGGNAMQPLAADHLAQLLRQAGVRVAVLGACDSGRRAGISPWEGVAAALLGAEVAAVVAMQYCIPDTHAIRFARGLYSALAVGLSIDEAVTTARLALFDDDYRVSWGVPVLYSRSPDGVLFREKNHEDSASAHAVRASVRQVVKTVESGGSVVGIDIRKMVGGGGLNVEVNQSIDTLRGTATGVVIQELHGGLRSDAATPGS